MELHRVRDADAFLARAGAFLVAREAEHNLLLGLAARLRERPELFGAEPWLAVLEEGGRVVGAAVRTPPHNVVLSELDDLAALEPLARGLRETYGAIPGLLGPKHAAAAFAELWPAPGRVVVEERIHRASGARPPDGVPGRLRPLEPQDHGLALAWFEAFVAEAMPHGTPESPAETLARRLDDPSGGLVVWDDGGAVSLAGYGAPTPNGVRIGPVYTPPELRGRGYASALVGTLTRDLLAGGRRFCFLFTDLANPTSNRIYRDVGYEPVTDVDQWAFDEFSGGPRS